MTEHLNQLNVKKQGMENTMLSLEQTVFAFENKLVFAYVASQRMLPHLVLSLIVAFLLLLSTH